MDEFLITTQNSLMNIDNDPPSSRRLLIYSSRIEDGKKLEEVFSKTGTKVQTTNSVSDAKGYSKEMISVCLLWQSQTKIAME